MCNGIFNDVFSIMPCAAFAEEASVEGQVESLEAEKTCEDDAFGERADWMRRFFAEDEDSLIGTLEADGRVRHLRFLLLQGFTLTSSMAQMIITD